MRKLITILGLAILVFIAYPVVASEQPSCPEDSHYEGQYVEIETCERVCTFSFFGRCLRYENRCTTSGSWEGSCVANPVEEEPIEEEPIEEGLIGISGEVPLWAILAQQCKEENILYSEWSPCIEMFNLQIRTAKPLNGCVLTGFQQANLVKQCGSDIFGLQIN